MKERTITIEVTLSEFDQIRHILEKPSRQTAYYRRKKAEAADTAATAATPTPQAQPTPPRRKRTRRTKPAEPIQDAPQDLSGGVEALVEFVNINGAKCLAGIAAEDEAGLEKAFEMNKALKPVLRSPVMARGSLVQWAIAEGVDKEMAGTHDDSNSWRYS